jgi:hypothetical protein
VRTPPSRAPARFVANTFRRLAISACLFASSPREASPEVHGRFKCCPDSHGTCAILSTCLAMSCTSTTLTATAFPSHSTPCHFLCTSHISSFAFLPYLPLPPPKFLHAFPAALCPFWRICCLDTGFECLPLLCFPFWTYCWNRLFCTFRRAQKHSNLIFNYCMSFAKALETQACTNNRIN